MTTENAVLVKLEDRIKAALKAVEDTPNPTVRLTITTKECKSTEIREICEDLTNKGYYAAIRKPLFECANPKDTHVLVVKKHLLLPTWLHWNNRLVISVLLV